MIRYGILGPLSVAGDVVTAGRDRIVLAMMLLHPDRVLSAGELIEALWGEQPPSTARGQLQTCVSQLRRALPPGTIGTVPAGYRFTPGDDEVDAAVFTVLVTEGRAQRDPALFRRALNLWRGPALADIDSLAVRRVAAGWDERRMAATEEWVELELAAGRERDLLGELSGLVEQFPLRERLRGQLMTALWRAGRQADALAEFRRIRTVLDEELGLEPGNELQELHRQILTGGPQTVPASPMPVSLARRPRCLPRTVGDFTGRQAVVERLIEVIEAADPAAPVIAVVDGMAGSGKTTLALHVAALAGDRFPDAHLYVDLHGHSTEQPLEPAAALLILLRQLGVSAERIPTSLVERVGLWRTELAGRRALVLLDNAASSAQLVDLLPTSAGSLALVTGRRRLIGLDGVHHESLGVLGASEAVALLTRIAGDRVLAEPTAALEVVRHCGGLPLALRLAGSRLAHRPRWRVADLVRRLGAAPLPELAAENRSVADAFALSFDPLAEPAQRIFRLLGVYPGASFDVLAVAALGGVSREVAQDALDNLVDVHLVEEPVLDSYRMHDLLREFAATLAIDLPVELRRKALVGVLDLQLHATAAVMPRLARELAALDLGNPQPLRPDLVAEVTDPMARFERERPHLAACAEAAVDSGRPEYGWWIPRVAWWYLYSKGFVHELDVLLQQAVRAAEAIGDRAGIATVSNYLASSLTRVGDMRHARKRLELCIRIREELGLRSALASPLSNLAGINERLGRYGEAIDAALRARRMTTLSGDRFRARPALMHLATASLRLGRYDEALRYCRLHYLYALDVGDESAVVNSLLHILRCQRKQGTLTLVSDSRRVRLLIAFAVRLGLPSHVAGLRSDLAGLLRREGRIIEAMAEHREALATAAQISDELFRAEYLNEFARTCRAAGDLAQAVQLHRRALSLAEPLGLAYDTAVAEAGIAECLVETDPAAARRSWRTALAAFREMGVPDQFEVEQRLAGLDRQGANR